MSLGGPNIFLISCTLVPSILYDKALSVSIIGLTLISG